MVESAEQQLQRLGGSVEALAAEVPAASDDDAARATPMSESRWLGLGERITELLCQLDAVPVAAGKELRAVRRRAIERLEALANTHAALPHDG